jgi:hypothetical protein
MSRSRVVSTHSDPPNVSQLIAGIPSGTHEIFQYAQDVVPGWIISTSSQFSVDLFKFNEQWAFACVKLNIEPQKVVIVTEAYLDLQNTTHTLIRELCRRMSVKGFVIMDEINFGLCQKCGEVIVSERRFRELGMKWLGFCQSCNPYDPKQV